MNAQQERTKSLWMRMRVAPNAPHLDKDLRCDTVIVGSGIAGISVAYELADEGQKVVVIDRGPVAGGMTSRTTAHLAPICDDAISALINLRGEEIATLFQQSQEASVNRIEAIIKKHGIACDFRRLEAYLFPALEMPRQDAKEQADKEYEAAQKVGAAVKRAKGVALKGFENAPTLCYARQATFHPLKYLRGLVEAVIEKDGRVFANSPVIKIEEEAERVRVHTAQGACVTAARAVLATNSPINNQAELHSKMAPYRTYAMAFTIPRDALPDALYWDMADPYHYVRLQPGPGNTDYLIAGGADHKSGEADDGDVRFDAIEAWIRQLVPALGKEVHRWSGQVLDTVDYCGFIGRSPGSQNVYVVTGDSGQGITHGALAGILLKDLILRKASPWASVYEPSRTPPNGIVNFVKENVTAIKNFAEYLMPARLPKLDELKAGEGGVIDEQGKKVAAYRDEAGKLQTVSAVCTHLGCHVHWNSTEQCWDCPCHGSHFAPDGTVLNAPAILPLEKVRLRAQTAAAATDDT